MGKIYHGYNGCVGPGYWLLVVEEVGDDCVKFHHNSRRSDWDIYDPAMKGDKIYCEPPGDYALISTIDHTQLLVNGQVKKIVGKFFVGDGTKPVNLGG